MKHDRAQPYNRRAVQASSRAAAPVSRDFVREKLDLLTGTHLGCEHGVCGACTRAARRRCRRAPASPMRVACEGAEVTTIEGLDGDDVVVELRAAFTREHALQCGYCTPGMLIVRARSRAAPA